MQGIDLEKLKQGRVRRTNRVEAESKNVYLTLLVKVC